MEIELTAPVPSAREVFANAVRTYGRSMYRAARALTGSDADAEDAVSEAVLRAWEAWPTLRDQEAVRPWLIKIAVNCAKAQARRSKRLVLMDSPPEQSVPEPDWAAAQDLWTAVQQLRPDHRAVVVLFYYEDLTLEQIAKVLSLPLGTVKSRLSRAREALRRILTQEEVSP